MTDRQSRWYMALMLVSGLCSLGAIICSLVVLL